MGSLLRRKKKFPKALQDMPIYNFTGVDLPSRGEFTNLLRNIIQGGQRIYRKIIKIYYLLNRMGNNRELLDRHIEHEIFLFVLKENKNVHIHPTHFSPPCIVRKLQTTSSI